MATTCSRCGEEVASSAAYCPACGKPRRDPPGAVTGRVRDLQPRTRVNWFTKVEETVLNFRVALFDDAGNLERLVPVEISGSSLGGAVNENDEVRVVGRFKNGMLCAKQIQNVTDGSVIRAGGMPLVAKAVAALLFTLVGAFMLFVGYQLVSGR